MLSFTKLISQMFHGCFTRDKAQLGNDQLVRGIVILFVTDRKAMFSCVSCKILFRN